MRFDVGSGGFIAILLTLAALSGVVFLMGVVAGYDVGRQTALDAQKSAVDYAVAPPASPAAVTTLAAQPAASPAAPSPVAVTTPPPKVAPAAVAANSPNPNPAEDEGAA